MRDHGTLSENDAIQVTTMTVGSIFGHGGLEHGLFEVLQANRPTNGLVIQAIGEGQRFWPLGAEITRRNFGEEGRR